MLHAYSTGLIALILALLLFGPRKPKRIAIQVAEAIQQFTDEKRRGLRIDPLPRETVDGLSVLAVVLLILFLALAWLSAHY
jgi:hypothetical protein